MIDYLKQNHLSLLIVAFLVFSNFASFAGIGASPAANLTRITNPWTFTGTNADVSFAGTGSSLTVGANGTQTNAIKYGSCTIWAPAQTITATTTQQIECQGATNGGISAITGITTDSVCQLTMASSTNTTLGGIDVQGVSASSTAGTIVARLVNLTGTTFTWSAVASSSPKWNYTCFDPS